MNTESQAERWLHLRSDAVRLYVFDGLELEHMKREMESRLERSALPRTVNQWTSLLRSWGIYKNLSAEEIDRIQTEKRRQGRQEEPWNCLVLANGVLLHSRDVQQRCQRKEKSRARSVRRSTDRTPRRRLILVLLSFNFARLDELPNFNIFRQLLWYTSVHFDSCFDSGIWSKDDQGLIGRSDELRNGLTKLSDLHNTMCYALQYLSNRETDTAFDFVRCAFKLNASIVQTRHHRQIPDIMAILLLIARSEQRFADLEKRPEKECLSIRESLTTNLFNWAEMRLHQNDPRRHIFQILGNISMDLAGDMYTAYDACCRQLWMSRAATDHIRAYYSYNQAGLPRADPGKFYELYSGRSFVEIESILAQADEKLGQYQHPTFCLWHTAIRYFFQEKRFEEAEITCRSLCRRLPLPQQENVSLYNEQRQLNLDVSLSFFLLGSAQYTLRMLASSMHNFLISIRTRSINVHDANWDPTLAFALEKGYQVAKTLGDDLVANECEDRLEKMRSAVKWGS